MNTMRTRLQALAQLDRAVAAATDEELTAMIDALPDDHRSAIDGLAGAIDGTFEDPAARIVALRAAVARGRMNGGLEQIATVLGDQCLADCIEQLGDAADNPTDGDLRAVLPGLVERHGLPAVRIMLAATVAGEAAASPVINHLLKHDDVVALPPAPAPAAVTEVLHREADDETKARRRAAKERKQAEARARRLQQARARNRA